MKYNLHWYTVYIFNICHQPGNLNMHIAALRLSPMWHGFIFPLRLSYFWIEVLLDPLQTSRIFVLWSISLIVRFMLHLNRTIRNFIHAHCKSYSLDVILGKMEMGKIMCRSVHKFYLLKDCPQNSTAASISVSSHWLNMERFIQKMEFQNLDLLKSS